MNKPWFMSRLNQVNYGIEGLHMCTTGNYRKQAVSGLPEIQENDEGICKGCAQGMNVKKTFPSSERKAKEILEIVHSDVCGPMSCSSLSGYVYYVSFIDDFSCNTWIYLLKWKR